MEIYIAYLHFMGIMMMMGSLVTEHIILKPDITRNQIKSLGTVDIIYGISAVVVLVTGLLRWFMSGAGFKGAAFYTSNPLFHIKLTVFVILLILSIFPTIKFIKWNRQVKRGQEPEINDKVIKRQLMFVRIQLLLLAIMPFLGVLIARGRGF